MNFSVTPAALSTIDLIIKIETTVTGMTTEEADTMQADLSSIIRKAKAPKRNITRKQSTTRRTQKLMTLMLTLKQTDVQLEYKARVDSLYLILGQTLTGS